MVQLLVGWIAVEIFLVNEQNINGPGYSTGTIEILTVVGNTSRSLIESDKKK